MACIHQRVGSAPLHHLQGNRCYSLVITWFVIAAVDTVLYADVTSSRARRCTLSIHPLYFETWLHTKTSYSWIKCMTLHSTALWLLLAPPTLGINLCSFPLSSPPGLRVFWKTSRYLILYLSRFDPENYAVSDSGLPSSCARATFMQLMVTLLTRVSLSLGTIRLLLHLATVCFPLGWRK